MEGDHSNDSNQSLQDIYEDTYEYRSYTYYEVLSFNIMQDCIVLYYTYIEPGLW